MKVVVLVLMIAGALAGLAVFAIGVAAYRSDIQLIFAAIGLFSALILTGLAVIVSRL